MEQIALRLVGDPGKWKRERERDIKVNREVSVGLCDLCSIHFNQSK